MSATTKLWSNNVPPTCEDDDLNGFKQENNNLIVASGQVLDTADNQQTNKAVAQYAATGDFYVDSGTTNAYVLSATGAQVAPATYATGMKIRFVPGNSSTGAFNVNVAGLGVVNGKESDGSVPKAFALIAGQEVVLSYTGTDMRILRQAVLSQFFARESSTPNMTVVVASGRVQAGVTLITVAQQVTAVIVAPTANPRIDRVVINSRTGLISVITGVEDVSPVSPNIAYGTTAICNILLQTATTEITSDLITDERPYERRSYALDAYALNATRSWSQQTTPSNNVWQDVIWVDELNKFVAIHSDPAANAVMTSPDGVVWTAQTTPTTNRWFSVCWSPEESLLVAVSRTGSSNRVMTSPDGINWTIRVSAADNVWNSVCWSSKELLFVAVAETGSGNRVMTSPDGINWTIRVSAADVNWREIIYACGTINLFVAVGISGSTDGVMTSPDGINWTIRVSAATEQWDDIAWSEQLNLLVAVGQSLSSNGSLMTSSDAIIWTQINQGGVQSYRSICWSSELGIFAAIATEGETMISADGEVWLKTSSALPDDFWINLCWSGALATFCAVASLDTSTQGQVAITT